MFVGRTTFFPRAMDIIWQELTRGLADWPQLATVLVRLVAAAALGAVVGFEREQARKSAGLRTHMLVCLGTAVFIMASSSGGISVESQSRVVQGVVTGIGFIGAGSILKLTTERQVKGLTTAAGIWTTAAIGVAVGLGTIGVAILCTLFARLVLALSAFEHSHDTTQK